MILIILIINKCVVLIAQSCPILWNLMGCSPPGSSVCGILQARTLEWIAIPFSRGSSQPRDWTWVSCMQAESLPSEPPGKPMKEIRSCQNNIFPQIATWLPSSPPSMSSFSSQLLDEVYPDYPIQRWNLNLHLCNSRFFLSYLSFCFP